MAIAIREAGAGELGAVARMMAAAFAPLRPGIDAYLDDVAGIGAPLEGGDTMVAAEADGGAIVGAGTLRRPHHRPGFPATGAQARWPRDWACLRLLAVDASFRRRGIGRALIAALIARARGLGAPIVGLHTPAILPVAGEIVRRLGWLRARAYDDVPAPGVHAEAYLLPLGPTTPSG